jgi:hypothetical protein
MGMWESSDSHVTMMVASYPPLDMIPETLTNRVGKAMSKDMMLAYVASVYATICESGKSGAPEGPMYSALLQVGGVSLETYTKITDLLIEAKLVRRYNNCLIALNATE